MNLKKDHKNLKNKTSEAYTLIEVVVTIFIMGMVLLIVNIVLISLIRVSYDTDSRMKIRQGVEFTLEVIRDNIKSSDPGTIPEVENEEELSFSLSESGEQVRFAYEELDEIGMIRVYWDDGSYINLTSPEDIDVQPGGFEIDAKRDFDSGTVEVIITIRADSTRKKGNGEPVVKDFYKQISVVSKGQEL